MRADTAIKYICDLSLPNGNAENRISFLSSENKGKYIIRSLTELGAKVQVISTAGTRDNCSYRARRDSLGQTVTLVSGPAVGFGGRIKRLLNSFCAGFWLSGYLIRNCRRGEMIIAYHTVNKIPFLMLAKWAKKLRLCLEVEEVYSELSRARGAIPSLRSYFEHIFIKRADCYIFVSEELNRKCNPEHKKYCVASGNYSVAPILRGPIQDGRIHLVYAGLIARGGAAFFCVDLAQCLDDGYAMHIIGYGEDNAVAGLKRRIECESCAHGCEITYDGSLSGEEYDRYLQSCHIGICPLPVDRTYQSACFPSKISSYLANRLRVVTTENSAIRNSPLGETIYYAADDKPQSFADTITHINIHGDYDLRNELIKEKLRFLQELRELLDSVRLDGQTYGRK